MAEFEKKTKRHSRKLDRASLTSMYVARYERDFLDYEFARAKVIQWGESAYPEERYICTQVLSKIHVRSANAT